MVSSGRRFFVAGFAPCARFREWPTTKELTMFRRLRSATTILLCAAFADAQAYTGEGPLLVRPFTEVPAFRPANFGGLVIVEGMAARREASGTYYLLVAGRRTALGQPRLSAWRWDPATSTLTRLTDVDAFTLDGDITVSLSHDLLHMVVFRNGAGIELSSRASLGTPFGPRRAVTGLLPNSYAPALGSIEVGLVPAPVLFACIRTPTGESEVHRYYLNLTLSQVTAALLLAPKGSRGNRYEYVCPIDDSSGLTRSIVVAEGQDLSDLQRMGHASSVDGRSPIHWGWDPPTHNKTFCAAHWWGGRLVAPIRGDPRGVFQQNTVVNVDTVLIWNDTLSTSGGRVRLSLLTPPDANQTWGALLLGLPGTQATPLPPGIRGNLGLDPFGPILFSPLLSTNGGVAQWEFSSPPVRPVTLRKQGISGDWFRLLMSNTSDVAIID
jgi:hypothetical protein